LFGLGPAEFREQTLQMEWMEKRAERIKGWVDAFAGVRTEYGNAVKDGNWAKAKELKESINFTSRYLVGKDIKEDVMNKLFENPITKTVAEQVAERYNKDKAYQEITERNSN
jgi:hypothetical protein